MASRSGALQRNLPGPSSPTQAEPQGSRIPGIPAPWVNRLPLPGCTFCWVPAAGAGELRGAPVPLLVRGVQGWARRSLPQRGC